MKLQQSQGRQKSEVFPKGSKRPKISYSEFQLVSVLPMMNSFIFIHSVMHKIDKNVPLTLSGPAFSVVRQARGGSEAQMPKIKVNINQLK